MSDISGVIEQIIQQAKTEARARMASAGAAMANDITQGAEEAIAEFYGSYSPVMYSRTGGVENTYHRLYRNHGDRVVAGVTLESPGGSYPNYNNTRSVSGDWIFELTYSGRHGATELFPFPVSTYPPVMAPSPIDHILRKRDIVVAMADSYF